MGANGTAIFVRVYKVNTANSQIVGFGQASATPTAGPAITVGTIGLDNLIVGRAVAGSAAVAFALTNGTYANPITAADFAVSNLPPGLSPGTATRTNDNVVTVSITGTPTTANVNTHTITTPASIHQRNVASATAAITPTGTATASAVTRATLIGTPTIIGTPTFGQTLTAVTTSLTSNPTGVTLGTLTYQWQRGTTPITGATNATYQLVAADVGQTIRVVVQSANTTGSVNSAATAAVARAAGAAVSGAPTVSTTTPPTANSITVNAVTIPTNPGSQTVEYAITTSTSNTAPTTGWVDVATFGSLNASTAYYVWARSKQNTTHNAGTAQRSAAINTAAAGSGGGLPGDYNINNL
jgi:hypothetical protein